MQHYLLDLWWSGSGKPISQASGAQTEGQFICNENEAARPTGMFMPVDQIFVPERKLYMGSEIIIRCVLGKHEVRGRGVKSKEGPCFRRIFSDIHPQVWGMHLLSGPSVHNASLSVASPKSNAKHSLTIFQSLALP